MLKDHDFFKALELASQLQKKTKTGWGAGNASRPQFMLALRAAHPFIFDKKTTIEKRMMGRTFEDFDDIVGEFSLPFKTSLYLMTDSSTYMVPIEEGSNDRMGVTLLGYLIQEQTPEQFMAWEVSWAEIDRKRVPLINQFRIDLKAIHMAMAHAEAIGFEIFDKKTEAHVLKETSAIMHYTSSISVKRIGIEKGRVVTVKNRGSGTGFTSVKVDNIIHIADKVEYEYTKPIEDAKINWDYQGFWRGHWRAFYSKANGGTLKDQFGWNVVDYGRLGKDRAGEYVVPGYTWVKEHTKGNPAIAEIKTRMVIHK